MGKGEEGQGVDTRTAAGEMSWPRQEVVVSCTRVPDEWVG